MTALLELHSVDAGYGARRVLHGVSLSVSPGEAWALLGPNGAGKSTLTRAALGLLPLQSGTARLQGHDVSALTPPQRARHAAWVPQLLADDVRFTALELVLMGEAPHTSAWSPPHEAALSRAHDALTQLEVAHLGQTPVAQLSGGERRRVWLARALMQRAPLLVLDEPTAFLDVRHQVEALRVVRAHAQRGGGALVALHDVNLVRYVATHVALLKDGALTAAGPVEEVLTEEKLSALYGVTLRRAHAFLPDEVAP